MIDAAVAGDLDKIIELKDHGIDINVFTPVSFVCVYKRYCRIGKAKPFIKIFFTSQSNV